jgi:hypothetical protein
MMKHLLLALALAACTKASKGNDTSSDPKTGAAPRSNATITLTSVTFADDCGGAAPSSPPPNAPAKAAAGSSAAPAAPAVVPPGVAQETAKESMERRRCEQTSMQLAIGALADTEIHIKSVEVFDETGKSLGSLTAAKPQRWADAGAVYEAWDEKLGKGTTARVSYALSQPTIDRYDSRDRTYTVKVVASVGGADQPLQTTVMVVGQPAPVPT